METTNLRTDPRFRPSPLVLKVVAAIEKVAERYSGDWGLDFWGKVAQAEAEIEVIKQEGSL